MADLNFKLTIYICGVSLKHLLKNEVPTHHEDKNEIRHQTHFRNISRNVVHKFCGFLRYSVEFNLLTPQSLLICSHKRVPLNPPKKSSEALNRMVWAANADLRNEKLHDHEMTRKVIQQFL